MSKAPLLFLAVPAALLPARRLALKTALKRRRGRTQSPPAVFSPGLSTAPAASGHGPECGK